MLQESQDLLLEARELDALLDRLKDEDWETPTAFMEWTPWDVIAHLHYFDLVSLVALEGEEPFVKERDALIAHIMKGATNQQIARERFGDIGPDELRRHWLESCEEMATKLGESDPKRRLPWFGPDMGVRMFTTARFMETWAHSQEIYDLLGVERSYNDRIKHICAIGNRTFGWTFVNRKMDIPGPAPYVRLTAPSGETWEWNEPSEDERVEGLASQFAHVVTQGRNIADTDLAVTGEVATLWMSIAQCFAGGAIDPPKPGERAGQ
ncbi:MAG: TIGR03084 family protein [bacterium]|nr:TIGR03084 family protein [bacterium]